MDDSKEQICPNYGTDRCMCISVESLCLDHASHCQHTVSGDLLGNYTQDSFLEAVKKAREENRPLFIQVCTATATNFDSIDCFNGHLCSLLFFPQDWNGCLFDIHVFDNMGNEFQIGHFEINSFETKLLYYHANVKSAIE